MIPIRKIAMGVGIASGALLTAWLLTGDRKAKTRKFIVRRASELKETRKKATAEYDDSEVHYI